MNGVFVLTEERMEEILSERVNSIVTSCLERFFGQKEQQQQEHSLNLSKICYESFFGKKEQQQEQECSKNLSVSDLCDRWNISKGTVSNYVKSGIITPIKLGRRVLFPMREVIKAESKYLKLGGGR